MKKVLFVCTSHVLTPAQLEGWDLIVEASTNLNNKTRQISPYATLLEIKALALEIVREALESKCKAFYCVGEPTLTFWANHFADECGRICIQSTTERKSIDKIELDGTVTKTAVFKHVKWREMF